MILSVIIPCYNCAPVIKRCLDSIDYPDAEIIVVDDGNDDKNKAYINEVADRYSLVTLLVHAKNLGKGQAMKTGLLKASQMGLTHILQIDSDGQHDAGQVPLFLELSRKNPKAIICGYPLYGADAPAHRVNG